MAYDVIIAGGGVAGTAAAIQLAQKGHRVLLLEKKRYPSHKLCGEFLSPEVTGIFDALGVLGEIMARQPHRMRRARLTTPGRATFEAPLPGPAIGLSRYTLDELLARRAADAGAEVADGTMVRGIEGGFRDGFQVTTSSDELESRVVLGAFGKRSWLDGALQRPFVKKQFPRVAFKAHYEGPDLGDAVELHTFRGGYCGLSHVEGGRINACWIGDVDGLKGAGGSPEAMIEHVLSENPTLRERFAAMERVSDRFEAVSQISLDRKGPFEGDVCMIGDTAGMIAPLCGDGMAMALQAAQMAAPLADDFLDGHITGAEFKRSYGQAWDRTFRTRLRLGRAIQAALERPLLASVGVRVCRAAPALGRWLVRRTRG